MWDQQCLLQTGQRESQVWFGTCSNLRCLGKHLSRCIRQALDRGIELRKKTLAREMNLAAIGIGMVFKAMRQDEITQGEGGSRTGPRQSPKELQCEHVKLKSLFYNKRN